MQKTTSSFEKTNRKQYQHKIFIKTISIAIFVSGLIVVTALGLLRISYHFELNTHKINAINNIDMQTLSLEESIRQVTTDLIILANQEEFYEMWNLEKAQVSQAISELEKEFLIASNYRKNYDQIRFLNDHGKETIRINYNNGNPAIIPQEKLQNKKGRYYFEDAFSLNPGEIFVSPLDLNIEHGKIEKPLKPMIRFATPVFDKNGVKKGIVLLNYFGEKMLKRFINHSSISKGHQSMLINADGYWLQGPYSDNLWGFMYQDRKDKTFENLYPEVWKTIKKKDKSQFLTAQGLYTYKTVYPLLEGQKTSSGSGQPFGSSKRKLEARSYQWKIVSLIPSEILYHNKNQKTVLVAIILLILIFILLLGGWRIAKSSILRKEAELNLIENKEHLQSIFKSAPTGIGVLSNLVLEEVNEVLCKMTGYKEDELTGQTMKLLYMNNEDYDDIKNEIFFQIRKNSIASMKILWKKKDGDIINVNLKATPTYPNNLLREITFTALDVTEQILAKKALKNSQERFLKVLNSIDATIHVSDLDTYKLLFMNKYLVKALGRDMTGELCYKALHGNSAPCNHCRIQQLVDKNQKPTGVITWQGKNTITGKDYLYKDRAIEWTDGRLVKLQIATDITKIKKFEEELRQARKMESIGTLTGGISHNFNNILGIILGNTELALDDVQEGNPAHSNLTKIKTASLRAKNIVRQLLSFSRKVEQKMQPIEIALVIKDALKFLRSTIPTAINIEQDIQIKDAIILADPNQINQIIMNICINASHAMEETGGTIGVIVEKVILDDKSTKKYPELNPGEHIKIRVSDTGPGINPDIIDRIFDPYFTTKGVGKGSGMGLSIVHGIIKNHNGTITVDSNPGKGTTFNILFPKATEKSKTEKKTTKEPFCGNEAILFVDDEISIAAMIKRMLERLGYKIETKMNPVEALDLFESKPDRFDLATYIMKPIDMRETAQTIRKVLDRK